MADEAVAIAADRLDPRPLAELGPDVLDMGVHHPLIRFNRVIETLLQNLGT